MKLEFFQIRQQCFVYVMQQTHGQALPVTAKFPNSPIYLRCKQEDTSRQDQYNKPESSGAKAFQL